MCLRVFVPPVDPRPPKPPELDRLLCQNGRHVPEQPADVDTDLTKLETELRRLEAEYNMFFAGRLPRPPWETRARVDAMVKRIDRARLTNYGDRFRFTTLQTRFTKFADLWDRALRAREEGRPGPLGSGRSPAEQLDGKNKKSPTS